MGKSTSDTFRDLLGGITDDLKEAFDDIIDYDEWERRGHGGRRGRGGDNWRQREDTGRRHGRNHDRRDDDRRNPRESGAFFVPHEDYQERPSSPPRSDIPRQSRRNERIETVQRDDVAQELRDLRSDLAAVMEALRQTTVALNRSATDQEPTRT